MVTLSLILMIYLAEVWHIKCDTPPITTEKTAVPFMIDKHPMLKNAKKEGETILNLLRRLTGIYYDVQGKLKIGGELIARIEILINEYPTTNDTKTKGEHCLNLLQKLIEKKDEDECDVILGKLQPYVKIFVDAAILNEVQRKQGDKEKLTEHPTLIDIKKESKTILNLIRVLDHFRTGHNLRNAAQLIARIEILINEYAAINDIKTKGERCLNLLQKGMEKKRDRESNVFIGKLRPYVEIFLEAVNLNEIQRKQSDKDKQLENDNKKPEQAAKKCGYHEIFLGLQEDLNTYPIKYLPKYTSKIENITQEVQWIIAMKTSDSSIISKWNELIGDSYLTKEKFAKIIATIYPDKSDIIHNIRVPEHCKTIDNYKKAIHDTPLNGTLTEMQIDAIDLFLNMKLVEKQNIYNGTSDSNFHNRCLILQNFPFDIIYGPKEPNTTRHKQKIIHRKIHKHKLRAFLKLSKKEMDSIHYSELLWTSEKREATGEIIVMFTNPLEAARAFINHDKRVANTVNILLVNCGNWSLDNHKLPIKPV